MNQTIDRKWVPQSTDEIEKLNPKNQNSFRTKAEKAVKQIFRNFDSRVDVDFGDEFSRDQLDCRLVNYYVAGIEDVVNRFSFLAKAVHSFSPERLHGAKGRCLRGHITFASDKGYQDVATGIAEDYACGFKSTNHINHTVYHEMGHAFFEMLDSADCTIENFTLNIDFIIGQYLSLQNMQSKDVSDTISTYANRNPSEMFAECFAEYCCSEKPRIFATQIVERALQAQKTLATI